MKIIIETARGKYSTGAPFNLCGSKEDLLELALQIEAAIDEDFTYGWIQIESIDSCEEIEVIRRLKNGIHANTEPRAL